MKKIFNTNFIISAMAIPTLVGSCSMFSKKEDVKEVYGTKDYAESIVADVRAKWFEGTKRFSLESVEGETTRHMFFDVSPDVNLERRTLNFVVATPEDSEYGYAINLSSGQHYLNKAYCSQDDSWGRYKGEIDRPPFTTGIVPRILDQLGQPQKIIIFGGKNYYQEHFRTNYFDARVIGGFIESQCPQGGCLNQGDWRSRLVLVGVPKSHKGFSKIMNLADLQQKVNWDSVKAFIENGEGRNSIGKTTYPGYRMGALVSSKDALRFLDKNSIFFTAKKLKTMRKACYLLYDKIWKELGQDTTYEKSMRSTKDPRKLLEIYEKEYQGTKNLFFKRFIRTFKKYQRDYKTCHKYIYSSNINHDKERHWFFAYYSSVNVLHGLGYTFDCRRKLWGKNILQSTGKRYVSLDREFIGCSARDIDNAIEFSVPFLDNLRSKNAHSYKYLDYDRGGAGTHNKIYNWVEVDNKVLQCGRREGLDLRQQKSWPEDIRWKRRKINPPRLRNKVIR